MQRTIFLVLLYRARIKFGFMNIVEEFVAKDNKYSQIKNDRNILAIKVNVIH